MNQLERELLRLFVEAEDSDQETRSAFDRLVGEDRVVLDMLWRLCFVQQRLDEEAAAVVEGARLPEALFCPDEWGLPVPTEAWWRLTEEEQRAWIEKNP